MAFTRKDVDKIALDRLKRRTSVIERLRQVAQRKRTGLPKQT